MCVCPCWWYFLPYQWARGLHASTVSAPRQYAVTGGLPSELGSGWQALGKVQGTPPLPSNATHRGGAAKQQRIILLSTGAHATSSFSAVLAPIFLISSLLPSPPLLLLSPFLASFLSAASLVLSIPNVQEHPRSCSPPLHRLLPFPRWPLVLRTLASRPLRSTSQARYVLLALRSSFLGQITRLWHMRRRSRKSVRLCKLGSCPEKIGPLVQISRFCFYF